MWLTKGNLKICDFGWAVHNNTEMRSTFCGTPLYFSPELLTGQVYDEKVDVWAIGVMVFELLFATTPFNLKHPQDLARIVSVW
jgi:serine/threonine protein kinase